MNGSIPYIYMPNPIYIMLNYLSSTILFFYLLRICIILFYMYILLLFFFLVFSAVLYFIIVACLACISLAQLAWLAIKNNNPP